VIAGMKRFHLYYLFLEEKARTKMSEEKSAEIWKTIEAFFRAMKRKRLALPTGEDNKQRGNS